MSGGSKFFRLQSSTPVKYDIVHRYLKANLNADTTFQIKPSAGVPEALGGESGVDGVAAAADSPGASTSEAEANPCLRLLPLK